MTKRRLYQNRGAKRKYFSLSLSQKDYHERSGGKTADSHLHNEIAIESAQCSFGVLSSN